MESWLPADIEPLAFLFPAFTRVPAITRRIRSLSHRMDEGQFRKRAFFALRELLAGIGEAHKMVFVVDDLQWGDSESADGLFDILLHPQPPPILLIGSFRADERKSSEFLKTWKARIDNADRTLKSTTIKVGPLTEPQVLEMVVAQLKLDPGLIRDQIPELINRTGGNPYLVAELADRFDRETGRFHEFALQEIVENRVRSLPEVARVWLELISVAGKATSLDDLVSFGSFQAASLDLLTRMRSDKLVRFVGSADQPLIDTYHDRIRETVLRNMRRSRKRKLHRQIGEAMERKLAIDGPALLDSIRVRHNNPSSEESVAGYLVQTEVFDLAYHFEEANSERAFAYQVLAGHAASQAFAMESAEGHLKNAEKRVPPNCASGIQYFLWRTLGSVCLRLRKTDEAFDYFEKSVTVSGSTLERAKSYYGIGQVHQQLGEIEKTTVQYDRALNEFNRGRPQGRFRTLTGCSRMIFQLTCFPDKWLSATTVEQKLEAELEFKICTAMISYLFEREPIANLIYASLKSCLAARKTSNAGNIAVAYATLGTALSGFGTLRKLGERFLELSRQQQIDLKDPELEGILRQWAAVAYHFLGKLEKSRTEYERAISLTERFGNDSDLSLTAHCYRRLLNWTGSTSDELRIGKMEHELALKSGNPRHTGWSQTSQAYALARAGRLDEALEHRQSANEILENSEFWITLTVFHTIQAFIELQCSQYEQARAYGKTGWELTKRVRGEAIFNLPSYCFWLESLAGPDWLEPMEDQKAREARQLLKQAAKLNRLFPPASCRVDRARARIHAALGNRQLAIKYLERAVKKGREIGMGYELARSLLDLANVSPTLAQSHRTEAIDMLSNLESVIPRAEAWTLDDQYQESLVAPKV